MAKSLYIANDVEAAGSKLGVHPALSVGVCLISQTPLSFQEYFNRRMVFYAELKPEFLDERAYEIEAMRVGCSHLVCLEKKRQRDFRFDPTHPDFDPRAVLRHMERVCEEPQTAAHRLATWINKARGKSDVVAVTDTVFFDSGHFNLLFGRHLNRPSPYGWGGLDLDSVYRGFAKRSDANLRELGVVDPRTKPHRADQDAVFLAQIAQVLLFEKLGW